MLTNEQLDALERQAQRIGDTPLEIEGAALWAVGGEDRYPIMACCTVDEHHAVELFFSGDESQQFYLNAAKDMLELINDARWAMQLDTALHGILQLARQQEPSQLALDTIAEIAAKALRDPPGRNNGR